MSLLDKIFRPNEAKKSDDALTKAKAFFQTLTAYSPVFTNWGGAIYESEIVRAQKNNPETDVFTGISFEKPE